jgi:glutathione peroxidase
VPSISTRSPQPRLAGLAQALPTRLRPLVVLAVAAGAGWFGLLVPAAAQGQAGAAAAAPAASCPALLRHTFPRLQDEKPQALCQYAGKVLLVVNTASYCGFTPQYQGLEALHAKYAARGLVVLGFPSNDFNQETGSTQQIADLCFNTYGVKFPMFTKTNVKGSEAHPFFRELARQADRAPRWNFHKYLVDRQGRVVEDYSSLTGPTDAKLVAAVEKALAAR